MKSALFRVVIFPFFLFANTVLFGQLKVIFADNLEERAELIKITDNVILEPLYTKSNFAEYTVQNFLCETKRDTISFQQDKKMAGFLLALLDKSQAIFNKTDHVTGELYRRDLISYQLTGNNGFTAFVHAIRTKMERIDQRKSSTTTVSNIAPDTSFVSATNSFPNLSRSTTMEVLFQGEERNAINGFLYLGGDTIIVRSIDKSKKGKASGVEIVSNKTVGGLQLPPNHVVRTAYFLIDNQLDFEFRTILFAALSVILIVNENRMHGG